MFYIDYISNKKILRSDYITDIEAFFTTRESCIKSDEIDMQDEIKINNEVLKNYLDISKLIYPQQKHTNNVEIVDLNIDNYLNTDGLIISNNELGIFLNFADCVPVILYDEINKIAAISHAGWRGTASGICQKTINLMNLKYNSIPKNIVALIGPAISSCCYNVGNEVLDKLNCTVENNENLYYFKDNKIYVDLKGYNMRQLNEIGVNKIDICPYCTCCNNDLFFSYRKENKTTSRHSAVIRL